MNPSYLVYDIETVPDLDLFRRIKYPDLDTGEHALEKFEEEEAAAGRKPFVPATFHYPVSCVVLKVSSHFTPIGTATVLAKDSSKEDRPTDIVRQFWAGVQAYRPVLVDFNGRGFDIPVLTMRALALGIPCPAFFGADRYGYRYRFTDKHIDLQEWVTSYSSFRLTGGLDLCSKLVGGLGKTGTSGGDVAGLWANDQVQEIDDYCAQDVMDTYRLFLRTRVLAGELSLEREKEILKDV